MQREPSRYLPDWLQNLLLLIVIAILFTLMPAAAFGQALDKPCFAVALEQLDGDRLYARTVIVVAPWPQGGHVGFILNRPTPEKMADLFPGHAPSLSVADPVYLGGPTSVGVVFALLRAASSPGEGSYELLPGVWLLINAAVIDEVIEKMPNDARYYAGYVFWKTGELAKELERGFFALRPADALKLFLPDTSRLYDELVPPGRKPKRET